MSTVVNRSWLRTISESLQRRVKLESLLSFFKFVRKEGRRSVRTEGHFILKHSDGRPDYDSRKITINYICVGAPIVHGTVPDFILTVP